MIGEQRKAVCPRGHDSFPQGVTVPGQAFQAAGNTLESGQVQAKDKRSSFCKQSWSVRISLGAVILQAAICPTSTINEVEAILCL